MASKTTTKAKPTGGRAAMLERDEKFLGYRSIGDMVARGTLEAAEVEKGLYVLTRKFAEWEDDETQGLACGLSVALGGQFHYSQYHVIRTAGKNTEAILSQTAYNALILARSTAKWLGSEWEGKKSTGAIGRGIVDWVCGDDLNRLDPQAEWKMSEEIARTPSWGCFVARPGTYENMVHIDVAAYYHSIATRIKNPLPMFAPTGELRWRNAGKAAKRWQAAIDAVGGNKPLRNTMIGQMCSGSDDPRSYYYCKGERHPVHSRPSKLAAVGHLIIRCGTEMSIRTARRAGAVYSCVDCVICPDTGDTDTGGTYWEELGFSVRRKGRGKATVVNLSNYTIQGGRRLDRDINTQPYELKCPDPPGLQYHLTVVK